MEEEQKKFNSDKDKTEPKLHTRQCHYCKQPITTKVGLDNWKNLFRKPTLDDWVVLIILILLLLAAFAYTTDTKACRETIQNLDMICLQRMNNIVNTTWNGAPIDNNTSLIVGNDTDEYGCKPSAGYSWCNATQKCIKSWEEDCDYGSNYTSLNGTE